MTVRSSSPDWDLVIRPKAGLLELNLTELWAYRDLLAMFVKRDIVTVYKQTVLGPLWYLLQPILTTVVFLFVFGNIAKLSTDGLPGSVFYLSGVVMWSFFADTFNRTSSTFTANAYIFGKVYFPRLITPLALVVSGLLKFGIQFGLFLTIFAAYLIGSDRLAPNAWLLWLPYLVLLMAVLGLAFGLIFSSLTTKYRDLTFLIQFGVQLLMYATPVIYPMSVLSETYREILWWNPVAHLVECFRYGFLGAGLPSVTGLLYAAGFSFTALFVGVVMFNQTERTFMDTV